MEGTATLARRFTEMQPEQWFVVCKAPVPAARIDKPALLVHIILPK